MEQNIISMISQAIAKAEDLAKSRESAIVVTKLQEALMWAHEYNAQITKAAARAGVGFSQDITKTGVQMTEPPNE